MRFRQQQHSKQTMVFGDEHWARKGVEVELNFGWADTSNRLQRD